MTDNGPLFTEGPETEVEVLVHAAPAALWPLISDIRLPARFSNEFQDAEWLDEPAGGARFRGDNANEFMGSWSVVCVVVEVREPTLFRWVVGDPDHPSATWAFELIERGDETLLTQGLRLGLGRSGLTAAIAERPHAA